MFKEAVHQAVERLFENYDISDIQEYADIIIRVPSFDGLDEYKAVTFSNETGRDYFVAEMEKKVIDYGLELPEE